MPSADATKLRRVSLPIGIVGLPNVGKSTLSSAIPHPSVNYPFATSADGSGRVPRPGWPCGQAIRLDPDRPASVRFIDIAGLVRGASQGPGLGSQFLAHICGPTRFAGWNSRTVSTP